MILDIQAPNLQISQLLSQAENLAESLGLQVHYSGDGRLTFTPLVASSTATVAPIVSVQARGAAHAETLQALRKIQRVAPKGAIVATNGKRVAVLAGSLVGWKEIES